MCENVEILERQKGMCGNIIVEIYVEIYVEILVRALVHRGTGAQGHSNSAGDTGKGTNNEGVVLKFKHCFVLGNIWQNAIFGIEQ